MHHKEFLETQYLEGTLLSRAHRPARVEFSLDYILARHARETSRESQSHRSPVEHHDITTIAALPTALPNPVSVWQKVKQAAITSGDYEGTELIDVPMSGGWESEDRTIAIYPVIRGNGTASDKHTPFQWPVLSELHQLVAKHSLSSTAIANMLRFLTTKEDNDNEDCQKVIELLRNENPSLNELINACAKVGSNSHNMTMLADSIAASVKIRRCKETKVSGQQVNLKYFGPRLLVIRGPI
ncbi:hypothetical protein HGM15179_018227, partial [Zosterops borbonicus]